MDAPSTTKSRSEFIELHRTFHELSKHYSDNDDADIRPAFGIDKSFCWEDLIKEYRLIILSEAGSGKTSEFFNIACLLREQGKAAFFLRLENIPTDFEDAFEVGTYDAFLAWLSSGAEGWLLLDSVDEARLRNPGDFELAIKKLSRRISTAKDRAHIVISGRTSAWRPKTDLAVCTINLPYAAATISEHVPQAEDNGIGQCMLTKADKRDTDKPVFKVYTLDDLTAEQIKVFVTARGIKDSKSFLDAVVRADALSFTSRPQDLEELGEFWIDKRRIGNRLEIMRNSIARRLTERDQGRAEACPLTAERARKGARLLAAAATLARTQIIGVPDGTDNTKGINVQSALSDWDGKEQLALLSRPIFDAAIYGAVRFHLRSVREYLAAEWFAELLLRETSRRSIEMLFFRNQYGLDIVVPTLRPVLPWLALLDDKIRARVREVAPEILFEGGDPSQLPIEVRRSVLHEVCEQMANGRIRRSMREYSAVQRFANPDLTDDIRALLRKYAKNDDLEAFLLRMVWHGQLAGALPEVLRIALMPTAGRAARTEAFKDLVAIGSPEDINYVRHDFLAEATELDRDWLATLIETVPPTDESTVWILSCLEKCRPKERFAYDHLSNVLIDYASTADINLLPHLAEGLNRLLKRQPELEHPFCEVSKAFLWLIPPACKAVERLILAKHPAALEPDALTILRMYSAARVFSNHEMSDVNVNYSELVPAWEELNRALFWSEVNSSRAVIHKKRGERLTDSLQVSFLDAFWRFEATDFEYLAGEISGRSFIDDKLVALSLAFNLYRAAHRPCAWRAKLKSLAAGNAELLARLNTYLKPPAQTRDSRSLKRQRTKWERRSKADRTKNENFHAGWKEYLINNLAKLRASLIEKPGTLTNPMAYLTYTRQGKYWWALDRVQLEIIDP